MSARDDYPGVAAMAMMPDGMATRREMGAALDEIDTLRREVARLRRLTLALHGIPAPAGGTVPADPPADPHRGMSFNTNPCNHSWPCEGSAIDHFCMWGRGHRLDFHKCQCSAVLPVAAPADPPEAQP